MLVIIWLCVFLIPEQLMIPVKGATQSDWHKDTFWYDPWGKSGVHKGIDIFADMGTPLLSASNGVVLYTGNLQLGGKVVVVLGPKWRIHYYAHLDRIKTEPLRFVGSGEVIGTVGDSGNAKGKAPHLHYSLVTLMPYVWNIDGAKQGWKKAFYLNPSRLFSI